MRSFIQELAQFCEQHNAERIHRIIIGEESPETVPEVRAWIRRCFYKPTRRELAMCAANALIGGHGVEAATIDGYTEPCFLYVNRGDTYDLTLVFDLQTGKYVVSSWGDHYSHIEEVSEF